jgi:hypothetical protein
LIVVQPGRVQRSAHLDGHRYLAVNGKAATGQGGSTVLPNIPPRRSAIWVTGTMKVTEDLTWYALWPHMHNRGAT